MLAGLIDADRAVVLVAASNNLAIDGTPAHANNGSGAAAVTLTTTQANDYIICVITTNGGPVTAVTGSTLGAFTLIQQRSSATVPNDISVWAKFATGALTGEIITPTLTTNSFCTTDAFGVKGSGQTSLVWDAGGPTTLSSVPSDPNALTTVNPRTMVIGCFRESTIANPTAGSGFSQISGAHNQLVEYKVISVAGTVTCTQTTGLSDSNASIAVAIVSV